MAPNCPEEVDVFKVPHSRMKELVDKYLAMMIHTNFADVHHMTNLLENLVNAFQEFRAHEQIENKYIMKKLEAKLKALSIQCTAVCNCHSDNRLTEMLRLLQDGYQCRDKSEVDRENYGIKLRTALEDFTQKFIPHMEEEEEVFQPMLMKYFSFEELRSLKSKVIKKHQQTIEEKLDENEECVSSSSDEDEKCVRESRREPQGIEILPAEVMMKIFLYLNPKELCLSAQVSKRWNSLAMDGSNWKIIRPVQWFRGVWSCQDKMDIDQEEASLDRAEFYPVEVKYDEDADVDESEESDELQDMSEEWRIVQQESRMLTAMLKHLLPRVGTSVTELHLGYSKGLSNGVLYRMLSCCPNLEILDLTQTRVSDIGFKSLGKNKCGRKLRHVNLSGCVNITDVALQRISDGLGSLLSTVKVSDSQRGRVSCCCQRQASCGPLGEQRQRGLDFDSVDQALRGACDFVERELMACHLMDILEGGSRFSPFLELSFLPTVMRDQTRTFSFSHWQKQKLGGSDQRKTSCTGTWSVQGNRELLPLQCGMTSRSQYSGNNQVRTTSSVERNTVHRTNNASLPERLCGHDPYRTNSSLVRGLPQEVCDNGDIDTPQRALNFLSLSGCSQVTDEGLRFLAGDGGLPHLEHLDLSGCMQVTASGLTEVVSACPSLDHAQLFYCDNMVDDPYAVTASGCQNLEVTTRKCCRSGF